VAELNEQNLKAIVSSFRAIEERLADPQVTADNKRLTELSRERARLLKTAELAEQWLQLKNQIADCDAGWQAEKDAEMKAELGTELKALREQFAQLSEELQLELIPKDADSGKNVYLEIRAGTGGDEAGLFARDLFRMYCRYLDAEGIKYEIQEFNETGVGGAKEAILLALGERAYDILHLEAGTHRVQRIPATEANGRIHTSAVTVAVIPEADEDEISINPADLRIDVFRSSGPGGQSVNTTDSAVRITHIPTGTVVSCQNEKSQLQNREAALRVLRARLRQQALDAANAAAADARASQVRTVDRSERIRTYNFPENRISDHRTGYKAYNLDIALGGELDPVVESAMAADEAARLASLAD